jgi:hypothetical protein
MIWQRCCFEILAPREMLANLTDEKINEGIQRVTVDGSKFKYMFVERQRDALCQISCAAVEEPKAPTPHLGRTPPQNVQQSGDAEGDAGGLTDGSPPPYRRYVNEESNR